MLLFQNITYKRGMVVSGSLLGSYVHTNGSYGALVTMGAPGGDAKVQELANKIAQHVVAMDPDTVATLDGQAFLFDTSKTVKDIVKPNTVAAFVRWGNGTENVAHRK